MPHYRKAKIRIWRPRPLTISDLAAVLDRLGDVRRLDVFGGFEIGDGARDFEDAGAGAARPGKRNDRA